MKKRSVGFNAILNILKTSMSVVFPLVTYRYAAQILEVENMGKVSYSSSVVSYFLLVAMLGIQVYATREGARVRDDKVALTKLVSEIFSINCISSTIAAFALLVCAFYIPIFRPYREMLLIFGLEIPLALLGSDWINSIFEDYVYITLRTIAFQIIAMICMFTLVRNKQDMFGYCVCLLISSRGSDLLNAFYTRRYVKKRFTISMNLGTHLLPIMYLFATNLASMLYSNADTTMLGLMTSDYCVGIYSTAAKVYNVFKKLLFAVIVVCLPRFSYMMANSGKEKYNKYANRLYSIMLILAIPLVVGILMLSKQVVMVIAGKSFLDASVTLQLKSIAILFAILGYFNMQLVLLPSKQEKKILFATVISAFVDILVNLLLIPIWKENAAAFSTVLAELTVFLLTYISARKIVVLSVPFKLLAQVTFASIAMGVVIEWLGTQIANEIICLIISLFCGVSVYAVVLLLIKNEIAMFVYRFIREKVVAVWSGK